MNACVPFPDLRAIWNDGQPRGLQSDIRFQNRLLHLIGAVVCDQETDKVQGLEFEMRADHCVRVPLSAGQSDVVISEKDLLRMLSRVIAARQQDDRRARLQALVAARHAA